MNDETGTSNTAASSGERVGFCQDCGKPLTQETARPVGSGVFCEPCLATRVGAGAPATGSAPFSSIPFPQAIPQAQGVPSPTLAAFLGAIPGVGAMYNGQYAKGLAHFAIFAVLMSLGDSHSLFGLMGFAWWVYQIFDAYHTAKARLEGLPLPNPFGLNDIGDRMGFGKGWPGSAARPVSQAPPVTPPPPAPSAAGTTTAAITTPGWVGYVSPTAFAQSPTVAAPIATPYADPVAQTPSWGSTPYAAPAAATYTNAYAPYAASPVAPPAGVPVKRFPTGAIWLIALGVLALLGTMSGFNDMFRMSARWIVPILLAALAIWIFVRRLGYVNDVSPGRIALIVRLPGMLMVFAVLLFLQEADWLRLARTWPVLLLAFGGLLLFERAFPAPAIVYPVATPVSEVPFSQPVGSQVTNDDTAKGGQA